MRISGGTAKGRRVGSRRLFRASTPEEALRPTPSKVRQALFNILRPRLSGASFLDLYAGTGAVGIEALSQGASFVVFVEQNPLRAKAIGKLTSDLGFDEDSDVVQGPVIEFLRRGPSPDRLYDIIFLDPPYASDESETVLPLLAARGFLVEDGIVIVEHASKKTISAGINHLHLLKTYRYGDTALTLYRKETL